LNGDYAAAAIENRRARTSPGRRFDCQFITPASVDARKRSNGGPPVPSAHHHKLVACAETRIDRYGAAALRDFCVHSNGGYSGFIGFLY